MGRNKKIKSKEEELEYKERRREQNRKNTRNYRLRKKLLQKIQDVPLFERDKQYRDELKLFLIKQEFNYFLTLTTKEERTTKTLFRLCNRFLNHLKSEIDYESGFFVVENGDRPHIHLLLKIDTKITPLVISVKKNWYDGGIIDVRKICSELEDNKLENYLMYEVFHNSPEINWNFI